MTLDLIVFLGAALGAFLNRAAGKNLTRSWHTVAEVLGPAASLVLLSAGVGLLPPEFRGALDANPFRTGLSAFLIALLMGPGLVTVVKSLYFRVKNGNGPTMSPGVKLGALLLLIALAAGCATGPPTVTFEAKGFMREYRRQRDDALLRMAPALTKCERLASVASAALQIKCDQLKADRAQWYEYDEVVLTALLTRQTVRSEDLEKAGEWAGKLLKLAADILL
jgi:hypothetical protein